MLCRIERVDARSDHEAPAIVGDVFQGMTGEAGLAGRYGNGATPCPVGRRKAL
jgi:hypothetical protein